MSPDFIGIRRPTSAESESGAEVAFDYVCSRGKRVTALVCAVYGGWEQFGAPMDVLAANAIRCDRWRAGLYPDFKPLEELV
jgi:hypothetical protein